jgi:CBS-domain-containing membrane protein
MAQQNDATDDAKGYELMHVTRDPSQNQTVEVSSFEEIAPTVQEASEHFDISADVVGVKENRHENGRYDIMVERNGFLCQHSHIVISGRTEASE